MPGAVRPGGFEHGAQGSKSMQLGVLGLVRQDREGFQAVQAWGIFSSQEELLPGGEGCGDLGVRHGDSIG